MFIDLYLAWAGDGITRNDGGEDYEQWSGTAYQWDTLTRQVTTALVQQRVYLTPVRDTPPADFSKPTTDLVDAYTVPANPNDPGYEAGAVGRYRRVYHDGSGNVRFEEAGLVLDRLTHTDETVAGTDGTATITASGGVPPLTASLGGPTPKPSQSTTSGVGAQFSGLGAGLYTLTTTDSATPPASVSGTVTIAAYMAPVEGCTEEYADNYDPAATADTVPNNCSYSVRWRSAWGPTGMHVRVAATPGQQQAFIEAELFIGFRPGHPLADDRPLGDPVTLRATVGPDGYATFRLGPFVRSQIGAPDGAGGYRLDLNSPTAYTSDLYVGYELRRSSGELLEHGYALNAAVPDGQLLVQPFANYVRWTGVPDYWVTYFSNVASRFGRLGAGPSDPDEEEAFRLPCPANPLPVRWLLPDGGYGFWIFQGRPQLGDDVADGQAFTEALTGERRWSERGQARRTITASSGVFPGPELMERLRTLVRSPQVWYQPVAGGPWVAVTLESGSFPAGRVGVRRQEVTISFTEASASYAQGQ